MENSPRISENLYLAEETLLRMKKEDVANDEDLKEILDDLICPICKFIIEDPKTCTKCERSFCMYCILKEVRQQQSNQCPSCKDSGREIFLQTRDRERYLNQNSYELVKFTDCSQIFKKLINMIYIICPNKKCNEIVKYNNRETHHQSCKDQYYCPNQGCTDKVTKQSEDSHTIVCKYRKAEDSKTEYNSNQSISSKSSYLYIVIFILIICFILFYLNSKY